MPLLGPSIGPLIGGALGNVSGVESVRLTRVPGTDPNRDMGMGHGNIIVVLTRYAPGLWMESIFLLPHGIRRLLRSPLHLLPRHVAQGTVSSLPESDGARCEAGDGA
jgi:hypothetical protein